MVTIWYLDTCECIIIAEENKFIKKCRLHRQTNDWKVVQTHNRQDIFQKIGTDEQREKAKNDEIKRIRDL